MISAPIELIIAAILWGFSFIATRWTLDWLGPLWMTSLRLLLAFGLMLPFLWVSKKASLKALFKLSIIPGLFLGATLTLQTWGQMYTTATNSGFITTLYVLLVPVFNWLVFRKKIPLSLWILVSVALIGTALISRLQSSAMNLGDLLTFFAAMTAAGHFLVIDRMISKITSPVIFNAFQVFWAGIGFLVPAFMIEPEFSFANASVQSISGLLFLIIGSTVIAFALQVRAQRFLSPEITSLLSLLESPFAAIFAFYLLGERLNSAQFLGAVLILLSATLSIILIHRRSKLFLGF